MSQKFIAKVSGIRYARLSPLEEVLCESDARSYR
jgi:hypothetical protein